MKKRMICFGLIFCLLLGGCGELAQPEESRDSTEASFAENSEASTEERTEHSPTESSTEESTEPSATEGTEPSAAQTSPPEPKPVVNSAFELYEEKYHYAGAVMLNEPFDGDLDYTDFWLEGEYERAYLIPRYVGSYVNLYGMIWDEEGSYMLTDKAIKSCYVEDGCIIYGAFERPEGFPSLYLEVVSPDGRTASYILSYDGRFGTPPIEPIPFDSDLQ